MRHRDPTSPMADPVWSAIDQMAEMAVIGSMLQSATTIPEIADLVKSDDFFDPFYREIFSFISDLFIAGQPADIAILNDHFRKRTDWAAYADKISGVLDSPWANPEQYARIVARNAKKRRIIRSCQQAVAQLVESNGDPSTLDSVREKIVHEATATVDTETILDGCNLLSRIDLSREALKTKGAIPTGFGKLDRNIDLFRPGMLSVIAGRPGRGKSTFCRNIVSRISDRIECLIFSLEMTPDVIEELTLFSEARIERGKKDPNRYLSEEDVQRLIITRAVETMKAKRWYYPAGLPLDVLAIKLCIARLSAGKERPPVVFVDHLQLMEYDRKLSENEGLGGITKALKQVALSCKVPIVLVSQLNRKPEDRSSKEGGGRPRLSDLRGSGSIEQDADNVVFLWSERESPKEDADGFRPEPATPVRFYVAKNRYGQSEVEWNLNFFKRLGRFENYADDDPR